MRKEVMDVDDYEFNGTQYVTVYTRDEWIYRFSRLDDDEPYTFDQKRSPDGGSGTRDKTPQQVVEYMESNYDCAGLHREKQKHKRRWPDW